MKTLSHPYNVIPTSILYHSTPSHLCHPHTSHMLPPYITSRHFHVTSQHTTPISHVVSYYIRIRLHLLYIRHITLIHTPNATYHVTSHSYTPITPHITSHHTHTHSQRHISRHITFIHTHNATYHVTSHSYTPITPHITSHHTHTH